MHDLEQEFHSRGPWVTCFHINGKNYGGNYSAESDSRLKAFLETAPSPGRVLELGCLEGGHTLALAKSATEVVGVDSREENLERARWVACVQGVSNVHFLQANLESFSFDSLGQFDWVFNVGLLYHLPEPWALVEKLAAVATQMFLWTHVADEKGAKRQSGGYLGRFYQEFGVADPLSGMSGHSFWPTYPELRRMLADRGFEELELIQDEPDHPHGPAVTLVCRSAKRSNGPTVSSKAASAGLLQ